MNTLNFDDPAAEIALFRHGLITQLIHLPLDGGRQEAQLRHLAAQRWTVPHSRRTNVSLSSLRRYLKAFRAGGFEALKPRGRSDRGVPKTIAREALERAVALRLAQPERTTPMIGEILRREGHAINTHTLATHLRALGKTRRQLRSPAVTRRRFERDEVNALWQGDAMTGPWLNGRRTHIFAFIDDHSRLVPYAEWFFDERLPRLERVFKVAMLRRGVPKAIYIDNGQVFHAVQFGAACATLGVQKVHATPYRPEGKGKIERFWHTLQTQFLPEVDAAMRAHKLTTLADLNASFLAWLEQLYHPRVHSETDQSPLDRFHAANPVPLPPDPETLRLAFQWRSQRKVSRASTIELEGNRYTLSVGKPLEGCRVELRYDPFDLSRVDVYHNDVFIATAQPREFRRQWHLAVDGLQQERLPNVTDAGPGLLPALRDEHQRALRQRAGTTKFTQLPG